MLGNAGSGRWAEKEDPCRPLNIDNQLKTWRFCHPSHTRRESGIKIKYLMNADHSKLAGKLSKSEKNNYSLSTLR